MLLSKVLISVNKINSCDVIHFKYAALALNNLDNSKISHLIYF